MKKIILSLAAVFAFGAATAQEMSSFGFGQGDVIVEGNLIFKSESSDSGNVKKNEFGFAPSAGYFISDDFAVGLGLNISSSKSKTGNIIASEGSGFGVGVYGRYYFLELGQRFKTYGQVGVGFGSSKENSVKSTAFNVGATLGVNYFLTERLAINFAVSDLIGFRSSKPEGGTATNTFGVNINEFDNFFATPTFGLTYKF